MTEAEEEREPRLRPRPGLQQGRHRRGVAVPRGLDERGGRPEGAEGDERLPRLRPRPGL
jgi:hypothetical protein